MPSSLSPAPPDRQQHRALGELEAILQHRRVPGALLLTGPPGTGKTSAAHLFAKALNCRGHAADPADPGAREKSSAPLWSCHRCVSCKKMDASMHPDIIVVSPEKETIKISRIREIFGAIASAPHESAHRMVLVSDAHCMNPEAANALLKILEEPPLNTFFILTATDLAVMLPTIISRCRHIEFVPLSPPQMVEILCREWGAAPRQAAIAAATARGNLEKARQLLNLDDQDPFDWLARRRQILDSVLAIIHGAVAGTTGATTALLLARQLALDTGRLTDALMLINTCLRDLLVLAHGPEHVINQDYLAPIQALAPCLGGKKIIAWIKGLHTTGQRIRGNADPRLALECFFLSLGVSAQGSVQTRHPS